MMHNNQNAFGQAMLQMRESNHLSRAELAKRVKMDVSHIFRLEKGARRPSRKTVLLIGEALEAANEELNRLLVAADHAPMTPVVKSVVRSRGAGLAVAKRTSRADRESLLEDMGINEANMNRLLNAIEKLGMGKRQEFASTVRSVLSIVAETAEAPIRTAVIPMTSRNFNVLAIHAVQRLLIAAVSEAVKARISRIVLILAPEMIESTYAPLKDTLDIAVVPPMTIHCLKRADGHGIGDMILASEEVIGDGPFAVLLPEYAAQPQGSSRNTSQQLARMSRAFEHMPGANLLAVARLPKYRMHHGSATVTDKLGNRPVLPIVKLFERGEASNLLDKNPDNFGLVGRYILQPAVFRGLREARERHSASSTLVSVLEEMRQKGHNVSAFRSEGLNRDAGMMFLVANDQIFANSEN